LRKEHLKAARQTLSSTELKRALRAIGKLDKTSGSQIDRIRKNGKGQDVTPFI